MKLRKFLLFLKENIFQFCKIPSFLKWLCRHLDANPRPGASRHRADAALRRNGRYGRGRGVSRCLGPFPSPSGAGRSASSAWASRRYH